MKKPLVHKILKPIMITCTLVTILAVCIILYIKKPNPPPYTIAKTQDNSDSVVRQGEIYVYTEATTEKHLFETAKDLANTYSAHDIIQVSFYRDGDPIDYGVTVGSATVQNKKVERVNIYNQADENDMRESVRKAEEEAITAQEQQGNNQPTNKQIAQFVGSSNKQSKKFTINTDEFTIKSRLSPDNDYGLLIAYLYNSDGTLNNVVANTTDNSPAETTIYGAGEYYLDINVANGKYNIRVTEDN